MLTFVCTDVIENSNSENNKKQRL